MIEEMIKEKRLPYVHLYTYSSDKKNLKIFFLIFLQFFFP